jgi:hypothetical protein
MSLDNEAVHLNKLVGVFELPSNNLQLGLLAPAIGPLKFARVSKHAKAPFPSTYRI